MMTFECICSVLYVEEVRRANPGADKRVFVNFQDDLASLLHSSVSSVAAAAYSKELITADVKDAGRQCESGAQQAFHTPDSG